MGAGAGEMGRLVVTCDDRKLPGRPDGFAERRIEGRAKEGKRRNAEWEGGYAGMYVRDVGTA